ncbi:glycerol-3-phosphate dehydrogenase [Pikeienuella piscinae]|uniref:Glycerol-3-phosphate dehydrogenase n=1 Tax=Pikeienuella piscinae TaxID=2748098 RepID=A0A7L5BUL0_9RHOB|nr:glycerol-3-phosphate dehydrogenase [Pikeienuella piscinae]QIE54693.1 glycerol-3-phosphate dehydrogenase [Pikeienuella piscinae]
MTAPETGSGENRAYDLLIIGGGVNGCGIARDAAGRGLSVLLVEMGDLGGATSSASTKLFHGGLRYLEYFEFRLVREALIERETLLRAMPHISWPLRFVLPINPDLRYTEDTSSLGWILTRFAPFLRGRRPAWLTRIGLFVYDHLGGRKILPATSTLDLSNHAAGKPLKPKFSKAFEYSDCWVEDSRLVALNARDAAARGAKILPRTRCETAARAGGLWQAELVDTETGESRQVRARALVNAGGPWVGDVLNGRLHQNSREGVRLVRGSHIVTRRLFDHDQPYFLQQPDGRIIFAIPYETDFTLIGTTDKDHEGPPGAPICTDEERDYLLAAASHYFAKEVTAADIVWSYSGVRPLYDDHASSATAATRDYVLSLGDEAGAAPLLNVFGGKITTYRRLSEEAVDKLSDYFPGTPKGWTGGVPLPGGDFPYDGAAALTARLMGAFRFLDETWARRLVRAYGTDAEKMLDGAASAAELGRDFGATLTEREVRWLIAHEWARSAEDVIWRRSKLGLRLDEAQKAAFSAWMTEEARKAVDA